MELVELLADLYLGEETGTLHLAPPKGPPAVLWFDRGLILAGEGSGVGEDPGQLLVEAGDLDREALQTARSEGMTTLADLVGLVDAGALRRALRDAARALIRRTVSRPACGVRFEPGEALSALPESDVLFTAEAVLEGSREVCGFQPVSESIASLESRVRLRDRTPVPLEKLTLNPHQGFLLSRLDGSLSLREVVSALPASEEEGAYRFVLGLAVLGVATFDPPLGEGRFRVSYLLRHAGGAGAPDAEEELDALMASLSRAASPSQVLGLDPDAAPQEARDAYRALRSRLQRLRRTPQLLERRRRDLRSVETRITESMLSLTVDGSGGSGPRLDSDGDDGGLDWGTVEARREYEKTETRLSEEQAQTTAEAYYLKAKKLFGLKDYHGCIEYMSLAVELRPDVDRYHHLLGEARALNPDHRWQKKAELDFMKAMELDPFNPDYMVSLAELYQRQGLGLRAKRILQKALELEPSHAGAATALKAL